LPQTTVGQSRTEIADSSTALTASTITAVIGTTTQTASVTIQSVTPTSESIRPSPAQTLTVNTQGTAQAIAQNQTAAIAQTQIIQGQRATAARLEALQATNQAIAAIQTSQVVSFQQTAEAVSLAQTSQVVSFQQTAEAVSLAQTSQARTALVQQINGNWSGSTSEGRPVTLVVNNGVIEKFVIEFAVPASCSQTNTSTSTVYSIPIFDGSFNFPEETLVEDRVNNITYTRKRLTQGVFQALNLVTGTFRSEMGTPRCEGVYQVNWEARR